MSLVSLSGPPFWWYLCEVISEGKAYLIVLLSVLMFSWFSSPKHQVKSCKITQNLVLNVVEPEGQKRKRLATSPPPLQGSRRPFRPEMPNKSRTCLQKSAKSLGDTFPRLSENFPDCPRDFLPRTSERSLAKFLPSNFLQEASTTWFES